jgi:methyl-accepting chemotaxis protein
MRQGYDATRSARDHGQLGHPADQAMDTLSQEVMARPEATACAWPSIS